MAKPSPGPNGTMITYGEGVVFVALPEMLVNITAADGRPAYLKLKLTLEAPDEETVAALTEQCRASAISSTASCANCAPTISPAPLAPIVCGSNCCAASISSSRRSQINAVLIEEMLVQ